MDVASAYCSSCLEKRIRPSEYGAVESVKSINDLATTSRRK